MANNPLPAWLDPIVKLTDFSGDPLKYIDHLFTLFERDFMISTPLFRGKKILFDKTDDQGKPAAFIHITTEENKATNQREISLRRCERISWIRKIIENSHDPAVLVWEKEHFGRRVSNRIYLFLECDDFLIILEEMKKSHYMITAIYVDNPNQKRRHLEAYEEFHKKKIK